MEGPCFLFCIIAEARWNWRRSEGRAEDFLFFFNLYFGSGGQKGGQKGGRCGRRRQEREQMLIVPHPSIHPSFHHHTVTTTTITIIIIISHAKKI